MKWWLVACALLAACPPPPCSETNTCPPPPTPSITLIVDGERPLLARDVSGSTAVSGCTAPAVTLSVDGVVKLPNVAPGRFTLPFSAFKAAFALKGVEASVAVSAEVLCEGGTKASAVTSFVYFPVEAQFDVMPAGAPNAFIAEGGANGVPTTLLGCSNLRTLERYDAQGSSLARNNELPFDCSDSFQLVPRGAPTLTTRWLLEPGIGVMAFTSSPGQPNDLTRTTYLTGLVRKAVQANNGDLFVVMDTETFTHLVRLTPQSTQPVFDVVFPDVGRPNATPVVNLDQGEVWASMQVSLIAQRYTLMVYRFHASTGAVLNGTGAQLQSGTFDIINLPPTINGVFGPGGAFFYFVRPTGLDDTSVAFACSTSPTGPDCQPNQGRRWISEALPGQLDESAIAGGALLVYGDRQAYLLDLNSHLPRTAVLTPPSGLSWAGSATGVDGSVCLLAKSTEHYTHLTTISPAVNGTRWSLSFGEGKTQASAVWMDFDEGNAVWLRVGQRFVRPLPMRDYCDAVSLCP